MSEKKEPSQGEETTFKNMVSKLLEAAPVIKALEDNVEKLEKEKFALSAKNIDLENDTAKLLETLAATIKSRRAYVRGLVFTLLSLCAIGGGWYGTVELSKNEESIVPNCTEAAKGKVTDWNSITVKARKNGEEIESVRDAASYCRGVLDRARSYIIVRDGCIIRSIKNTPAWQGGKLSHEVVDAAQRSQESCY